VENQRINQSYFFATIMEIIFGIFLKSTFPPPSPFNNVEKSQKHAKMKPLES
jgi:hypothetical protein